VERLIEESDLNQGGYGVILPMSSAEPDSAIYYARLQFTERGLNNIRGFNFRQDHYPPNWIDSLEKASLIYISGGDQRRFMEITANSPVFQAIHTAYRNGAVIAGTSAGAAVMSKLMITGDEKKHPEYQSTFGSIEADNIIFDEGLGLLPRVIVDQHFIRRSRYNRLLTAILENPEYLGIGIEESTAILTGQDSAEVVGAGQVVVLEVNPEKVKRQNGLLGAEKMTISVYLPGDKFLLRKK
jgi:cyanophycinase